MAEKSLMPKTFKKSSILEIQKICEWHKAGTSVVKMAKKLKRNHTSILYWLKKSPRYIQERLKKLASSNMPKSKLRDINIDKFIVKKRIKKEMINLNQCVFCHKDKLDSKWIKTLYCSLKCYALNFLHKHPKQQWMIW